MDILRSYSYSDPDIRDYMGDDELMTDKLDIFEMPIDAKVQTTIEELQRFYWEAFRSGGAFEIMMMQGHTEAANRIMDENVLIHGDIV